MGPAFTWLLALRYLTSRWVNLLGILGVAVAVWALIVVRSVFSGFIADIHTEVRRSSPDLLLTSLPQDTGYDALRDALVAEPDVEAVAPRLRHYGVFYQRSDAHYRNVSNELDFSNVGTNFVQLIGIDPASERLVTPLDDWLERARTQLLKGDQTAPQQLGPELQVPDEVERRARLQQGLPVPGPGQWRAHWPGLLLGRPRVVRVPWLRLGNPLDLVSVAWPPGATGDEVHVQTLKQTFAFAGAFATGARIFDEVTALVAIEPLRTMLGDFALDEGSVGLVTDVAIRARRGLDDEQLQQLAGRLLDRVRPVLPGSARPEVLTWRGQNTVFLDAVDLERAMTTVVLFVVMLIAAFLIYATLHMMVTQKTKDIGILTALGGAPAAVGAVFTRCGGVIGLCGSSLGVAAGIGTLRVLNPVNDWMSRTFGVALFDHELFDLPEIPYRLDPVWVVEVALAALLIALFVAWLPARAASRLHPVKTLAYE